MDWKKVLSKAGDVVGMVGDVAGAVSPVFPVAKIGQVVCKTIDASSDLLTKQNITEDMELTEVQAEAIASPDVPFEIRDAFLRLIPDQTEKLIDDKTKDSIKGLEKGIALAEETIKYMKKTLEVLKAVEKAIPDQ